MKVKVEKTILVSVRIKTTLDDEEIEKILSLQDKNLIIKYKLTDRNFFFFTYTAKGANREDIWSRIIKAVPRITKDMIIMNSI